MTVMFRTDSWCSTDRLLFAGGVMLLMVVFAGVLCKKVAFFLGQGKKKKKARMYDKIPPHK